VTEDGRYLIISVWRGTEPKNQVFYKDLRWTPAGGRAAGRFDAEYELPRQRGPVFWLVTDRDAPLAARDRHRRRAARAGELAELIPRRRTCWRRQGGRRPLLDPT
jgi:hypothetical protein